MYTIDELKRSKGCELYKRAKRIIPGGTQLLSKRPEMFCPDVWPAYYSKAKGSKVWDMDGREFLDMSIMSVGACVLGYADSDVDAAVLEAVQSGVSSSLNAPEEVELAELLIEIHPWFDQVRYCRSGGEAMGIAVRIARAATQRDVVMFSGYHGWNDWYLSANLASDSNLDGHLMAGLEPKGVPRGLRNTAMPFDPCSIESLKEKVRGNEKNIAAIVIEPARGQEAGVNYLNDLCDYAKEVGAVLIFDEITSGFRACLGGIHRKYKVDPDIAVFAKSIANGYAMAAILGKSAVMDAAQKSFISSTNWTERLGPAAAIATIKKYRKVNADKHIIRIGNLVKELWAVEAEKAKLDVAVSGLPALASFSFEGPYAKEKSTIFTIEMLKQGVLGFRQFKSSYSHSEGDIQFYRKALKATFKVIQDTNSFENLAHPVQHSGFSRLTKE